MRLAVGFHPDPLGSYSAPRPRSRYKGEEGQEEEGKGWELGWGCREGKERREWVGRDGKGQGGSGTWKEDRKGEAALDLDIRPGALEFLVTPL